MCDCNTKHPGIDCSEAGCTCHEDSMDVWAFGLAESIGRMPSEGVASVLAEQYREVIYFFARLTT